MDRLLARFFQVYGLALGFVRLQPLGIEPVGAVRFIDRIPTEDLGIAGVRPLMENLPF
jgi:hypothetical protein